MDINSNITLPIEITKASEIVGGSVKILFDPNIAEVQRVESGDFGIPIANIDNANGFVFIATSSASARDLEITDASLNYESGTLIPPTTSNGSITVVSKIGATLSIGHYTVDINSNITLPIEITKASEIAGGSVKILFDPNVAEVQGVESGDFGIPIANIDNANGLVFIATSSASAICKENATLAKVVFIGIATGTTTLEITDASLNNESGTLITPTTSNGAIKVVSTTEVKGDFILKQLQMEKLPWNFQVQV